MKKIILSLFAVMLFAQANASHLLGGEMYFDKLAGAGQYKLTLLFYLDGGPFVNPQSVNTTI